MSKYALAIGGNKSSRDINDYYATPPSAIDDLLHKVLLHDTILELA